MKFVNTSEQTMSQLSSVSTVSQSCPLRNTVTCSSNGAIQLQCSAKSNSIISKNMSQPCAKGTRSDESKEGVVFSPQRKALRAEGSTPHHSFLPNPMETSLQVPDFSLNGCVLKKTNGVNSSIIGKSHQPSSQKNTISSKHQRFCDQNKVERLKENGNVLPTASASTVDLIHQKDQYIVQQRKIDLLPRTNDLNVEENDNQAVPPSPVVRRPPPLALNTFQSAPVNRNTSHLVDNSIVASPVTGTKKLPESNSNLPGRENFFSKGRNLIPPEIECNKSEPYRSELTTSDSSETLTGPTALNPNEGAQYTHNESPILAASPLTTSDLTVRSRHETEDPPIQRNENSMMMNRNSKRPIEMNSACVLMEDMECFTKMKSESEPFQLAPASEGPLDSVNDDIDVSGDISPRKKIKIDYIDDPRNRQVTFLKRKNGVMKKAMELSILCECQVAVMIYNRDTMKMFEYGSHEMSNILARYSDYGGPNDARRLHKDDDDDDDVHSETDSPQSNTLGNK